jgi:hypothetical protein
MLQIPNRRIEPRTLAGFGRKERRENAIVTFETQNDMGKEFLLFESAVTY